MMRRREKVKRMVRSRNEQTGIRVKNTRSKRTHKRMSAKQFFMIVLLLMVFMGSGIGYVWSNFERTQIGYDLTELKKEEMRLQDINRKLRLELARLKSTQRLERLSTQKLGLKKPSPEQIITLP